MAWEENSRICLHMQLIAILSRTGVTYNWNNIDKRPASAGHRVKKRMGLIGLRYVKAW